MALILPHERVLLVERLQEASALNDQAARDMANAIENGNVWHDNSEYDEAIERMKSIDSRFGHLADLTRNAEVTGYPYPGFGRVAIGSLVGVRSHGDEFSVALVGQNFVGTERYLQAWEEMGNDPDDLSVTGSEAPLGAALLDSVPDQKVIYEVEGREFGVTVASVDQDWIRTIFAADVAAHASDPIISQFV